MFDTTELNESLMEKIDKKVKLFADSVLLECHRKLTEDGKHDTGNLARTANINKIDTAKYVLTFPVNYASDVEFGRLPGKWPYYKSLHRWVRRKLRITDKKKNRNVAWAIMQSIKQRGIEPYPFVQHSLEKVKSDFDWEVE